MACFKTKTHQDVFDRLLRACRSNDLSRISNPNWKAKLQAIPLKDIVDISNRFVTVFLNGHRQTSTCLLLASTYSGVDMLNYLIRHLNADVRSCDHGTLPVHVARYAVWRCYLTVTQPASIKRRHVVWHRYTSLHILAVRTLSNSCSVGDILTSTLRIWMATRQRTTQLAINI